MKVGWLEELAQFRGTMRNRKNGYYFENLPGVWGVGLGRKSASFSFLSSEFCTHGTAAWTRVTAGLAAPALCSLNPGGPAANKSCGKALFSSLQFVARCLSDGRAF